jgi:transcriptional regulator GlxA family with amidase domain
MFTRRIGMSPGRYILTVKMREAQRLLTSYKKMRISEIALRTGFTDQKYFCRTYHAYFGHAPSRAPRRRGEFQCEISE